MMTITELVSHLQAIYTEHGDIGVRIDADFTKDTQPQAVTDLVVGQFCYLLDIQLVGQPGPQNADSWF